MIAKKDETAILPLGLWQSLRWICASFVLVLAAAIAPKEVAYLDTLAEAARYAADRVKGRKDV